MCVACACGKLPALWLTCLPCRSAGCRLHGVKCHRKLVDDDSWHTYIPTETSALRHALRHFHIVHAVLASSPPTSDSVAALLHAVPKHLARMHWLTRACSRTPGLFPRDAAPRGLPLLPLLADDAVLRAGLGIRMPLLASSCGFQYQGEDATAAVADALRVGFRHVVSSIAYDNEEAVVPGLWCQGWREGTFF